METYYSAKERRAQILQLLKSSPKILVSSLSQMFNISEVTIRKDLEELENRNLLIRVRGGAIRLPKLNIAEEQATTEKKRFHYREKRSIGRMAATLIQENDTIILDSGSTTMEIAKNLHSFKQLTIITNAIDIAIELSKYKRFNVILLGGHLRDSSLSMVGPIAENTLKIFLGVDSFNLERGVSTPNIEEANINQTMITMVKETIAVFDSSKVYKKSFAFIAPVSKLSAIVTDNNMPPDIKTQIKKMGVKLYETKPDS